MSPTDYYTQTRDSQAAKAKTLHARYNRLALVRLVVFLGLIAAAIVVFTSLTGWALVVALVVTLALVPVLRWGIRYHQDSKRRAGHAERLVAISEGELRALDYDFSHYIDGVEYRDPGHPYAVDLDIFGPHSLYQFLNRTVTAPGRRRLADFLLGPADGEVVEERRRGGRALVGRIDWVLDFRAAGAGLGDRPEDVERLRRWLERPAVVTDGLARTMRFVAPVLTVVGLWFCFTQEPWQLGLLFFGPAIWVMRKYGTVAAEEHAYTAEMGKIVRRYGRLLGRMEREDLGAFAATVPQNCGRAVDVAGSEKALTRLAYAIGQLDVRYNPFVAILELTGLWSVQWLYRLDRWRAAHREDLPRWLDALAELDALISLATLRFNQPDWPDSVITPEKELRGHDLAHPLLAPKGRVGNNITIGTDGHIHLVTGSNMAGKSTWLRTVGINLVLSQAGAPVCALPQPAAPAFSHPPLQVWTSMRTQDDLSESTSSFYAELKRLKTIIEAVKHEDTDVFFLLDEILKGTNSVDRHRGARALIRQLIRDRGAGLIATHDLELAALENEAGSRVENWAMEIQTEGDALSFDYKVHRGVSTSFNATALMRRMGIEIPGE